MVIGKLYKKQLEELKRFLIYLNDTGYVSIDYNEEKRECDITIMDLKDWRGNWNDEKSETFEKAIDKMLRMLENFGLEYFKLLETYCIIENHKINIKWQHSEL